MRAPRARTARIVAALAASVLATGGPRVDAQPCPLASFSQGLPLPFDGRLGTLTVRDLGGDGRPDLLFSDGVSVETAMNLGGGTFGPPREVARASRLGAVGDFNGDGRPDLVLLRADSSLALFVGDGSGGFRDAGPIYSENVGSWLVTGDFDGNGALDIGVFTSSTPSFAVFLGVGDGRFRMPVFSSPFPKYTRARAVDLDHDGRDDLVWTGTDYIGLMSGVVFSNGDGSFRKGYSLGGGWEWFVVAWPADVNGDGNPDFVKQDAFEIQPFSIVVDLTDRTGKVVSTVQSPAARGPDRPEIAIADFDGDDLLDLAWAGKEGLAVVKGDGAGGFDRKITFPATAGDPTASDIDGDGRTDVVVNRSGDRVSRWHRNTCPEGLTRTLVVPVILSAPGAAGAFWESDLTITNAGSTEARLDLVYTPAVGGGAGRTTTTIPPGTQLSGASALELLERLGIPGSGEIARVGTLRARFTGLAFPRAAAISVQTSSFGAGVAYPGMEPDPAPRRTIGWLKQDAEDRSNLGLVNAGDASEGDIVLRVTLLSTDPAARGSAVLPDVTVPPGGFHQIDRVLEASGLGATSAVATVERVAGTAPFICWGVVNDAISSDGSFVPGKTAKERTRKDQLSSVVETAAYRTEVVLSNVSSRAQCPIRLYFSSEALREPARLDVSVPPTAAWRTPDVVDELRSDTGAGIPPWGSTIAGTLWVFPASSCSESIEIAARVLTEKGDGRRFGVLVPGLPEFPQGLAADSRIVWIPDLRQDSRFRSNLSLVETRGTNAVYRVELFSTEGQPLATRDVPVRRDSWLQVDGILAQWAPGVPRAWARVTRLDSPTLPATAYAVVNDGAAPGLGTGDGSIVWMEAEP